MGGRGSTRWSTRLKKTAVEDCIKLDMKSFFTHLIPGISHSHRWQINGSDFIQIKFTPFGDFENIKSINLDCRYEKQSGTSIELFSYKIELATTILTWGKNRYWFICPKANCKKRVRCLYIPLGTKIFACRTCYDLTYSSSQNTHKDQIFWSEIASRWLPSAATAMDSRESSEICIASPLAIWRKFLIMSVLVTRRKSKRCTRERIVAGIL